VSCQHLFRSGGGCIPPVSAPGHGINFSHGYQHTFRQGCGAVVKMTQFRLRSSSFMNMALAPAPELLVFMNVAPAQELSFSMAPAPAYFAYEVGIISSYLNRICY